MFKRKESTTSSRVHRVLLFCSAAAVGLALVPPSANAQKRFAIQADPPDAAKAQTKVANKAYFCSQLGKTFQASSGAQMYCFGPQPNGPGVSPESEPAISPQLHKAKAGLANVDAASRYEDRTNSGAYIGGQSETSISASGNNVVEAWNDGTGFFAGCGSPNYKEELTGYAFSSDGGKSFTDLGGLPNNNCSNGTKWFGDASVGTYSNSGFTYFYVSSLYGCNIFPGCPAAGLPMGGLAIALSACQVTGSTLSCGQPTIVATGNCNSAVNCFFPSLDKDYLAVDQKNKRLYISYTDFTFSFTGTTFTSLNEIDLAACDLDNPWRLSARMVQATVSRI